MRANELGRHTPTTVFFDQAFSTRKLRCHQNHQPKDQRTHAKIFKPTLHLELTANKDDGPLRPIAHAVDKESFSLDDSAQHTPVVDGRIVNNWTSDSCLAWNAFKCVYQNFFLFFFLFLLFFFPSFLQPCLHCLMVIFANRRHCNTTSWSLDLLSLCLAS